MTNNAIVRCLQMDWRKNGMDNLDNISVKVLYNKETTATDILD